MSGAGAQQVAFTPGTSFGSISGTPTYFRPGFDVSVDQFQIQNNRTGLRTEDETEPSSSVEGRFMGTIGLTYTMSGDVHDDVRNIVFNDGGTGITTGLAPTSRWFVGTDYLDTSFTSSTVEVELRSCIPQSYSITYEAGTNTVRENLTLAFADTRLNTAFTPGSITGPSTGSEAPFHGTELTVDGNTVNRNQGVTVEWSDMYRYQWEDDRHPVSAVPNMNEPTMTSTVIYHSEDNLGFALSGDSTAATQPSDELGEVSGNVAFSNSSGVIARYTFSALGLNQWQGQQLTAADADFQGVATWRADGGTTIATT